MKALAQAIHTALRDDSAATVGIRALLAQAATPWGVYHGHFPESPNLKSGKSYVTWYYLPSSTIKSGDSDVRLREQPFCLTAWSENIDTVNDIHKRARFVLEHLKGVTLPTVDVQLSEIIFENAMQDLFDDDFKAYYRPEHYRAYYREDINV